MQRRVGSAALYNCTRFLALLLKGQGYRKKKRLGPPPIRGGWERKPVKPVKFKYTSNPWPCQRSSAFALTRLKPYANAAALPFLALALGGIKRKVSFPVKTAALA